MGLIEDYKLYRDYEKVAKQAKGMTMQNWKTTVFGLIGGVALALGNYAGPNTWHGYLAAAALAAIGILAKDFNITLSASEVDAIKQLLSKTGMILLIVGLALMLPGRVHAQTATAPTTPTTSAPNGFAASSAAVAIRYAGAWSAGTHVVESYDFADLGATKSNHLYLEGHELLAPTPGISIYAGGLKYEPDLTALFKKTNVPVSNFGVSFSGALGNGIPTSGGSHISFLVGGGVKYQVTSALTWQSLEAEYGQFGKNRFAAISTGLSFVFGGK